MSKEPDNFEKTGTGPASSRTSKTPEELRDYFFTLNASNYDLQTFKEHWAQACVTWHLKTSRVGLHMAAKMAKAIRGEEKRKLLNFLDGSKGLNLWEQNAGPKLHSYDPSELTSIGWAFGEIGWRPSRPFLEHWMNLVQSSYGYDSFHLYDQIATFAKLELYPGDEFMQSWFANAESMLYDMRFTKLSHMLWRLANIAAKPPLSFMEECQSYVEDVLADNNIHEMNPIDFRMYLWGITVLSATSGHMADRHHIEKVINKIIEIDPDHRANKGILSQAGALFDIEGHANIDERDNDVSRWEKHLKDGFLSVSGFKTVEAEYSPLLQHIPDITGLYKGKRIIIEADGIYHFIDRLDGKMMFNGSTRLQTVLLQKAEPGSRILRLCYKDFHAAAQGGEDIDYKNVLDKLARANPGIYKSITREGEMRLKPFFKQKAGKPVIPGLQASVAPAPA